MCSNSNFGLFFTYCAIGKEFRNFDLIDDQPNDIQLGSQIATLKFVGIDEKTVNIYSIQKMCKLWLIEFLFFVVFSNKESASKVSSELK